MRKKTHDEYVKELKEKNPTVEVVEKYVNADTKIMHHCLIHDVYWETTPSRILNGAGCEECRKKKFRSSCCKDASQYVNQVHNISPHIIVIEPYINARTKILHRCTKHNIEWKAYPDNILKGCGCYECGKEKIGYKNRKNHDKYVSDLKLVNKNIVVLGNYQDSETPILHKCLLDGYEWLAKPGNILFGKGCPKCAGNLQLTPDEYVDKLKEVNPYVIPIENYVNANTKIKFKCLIDGHQWLAKPSSLLMGCGCPKCGIKKSSDSRKLNKEDVIKRIEYRGGIILNQEEYINCYEENLKIICPSCGDKFITSLIKFTKHKGFLCNNCFSNESSGEHKVRIFLENNNIDFIQEYIFDDCKDKNSLLFDFYLPVYGVCIEYQGEQHYRPIEYFGGEESFYLQQKHDQIKRNYCKHNNIKLLEIPYWEDIEKVLNNFLFI